MLLFCTLLFQLIVRVRNLRDITLTRRYADRNVDIVSESLRALGNFTRDRAVRHLVNELRGTELVILLLEHRNLEILYSSCGVLLNFAADSEMKELREYENVVEKLFDVVDRT